MATLMSLAKARNANWCRMSHGRLPYCGSEELLARWAAEADDVAGVNGDALFENKTDGRAFEFVGYSINGTAKSCALQGGCLLNGDVKPAQFDRNYFLVPADSRREQIFTTDNDANTSVPFYLRTEHKTNVTERIRWWNTAIKVHFKALILPKYLDFSVSSTNNPPSAMFVSVSIR